MLMSLSEISFSTLLPQGKTKPTSILMVILDFDLPELWQIWCGALKDDFRYYRQLKMICNRQKPGQQPTVTVGTSQKHKLENLCRSQRGQYQA